ncbi:hypothetical protein MANES_18G141904v8 [Manihot esculenta]|uniref:Uncharacterized protein n=1 Tax=Manihot esculenta TaxID=3983 RepID=A0ACB7G0X1_MANES|nr:hypothetical protein MANES_18G141904v8 [Manihot esculenta]
MLTSLLVPYIFFSLPAAIFNLLRGGREMDCFHCSGAQAFLSLTLPRYQVHLFFQALFSFALSNFFLPCPLYLTVNELCCSREPEFPKLV